MSKLINIFSSSFAPLESKAFSCRPDKRFTKATGLLFSNDSEVSISFENNQSLTANQVQIAYKNEAFNASPNKRAIAINECLNSCSIISGTVTNNKTIHQENKKRIINVYLIVE